ncbi:MAG: hypothetical protein KDA05_01880 [Phycisphaerales bacterium]|nr:hypothetical protein [Phycisphaerales bacterium]
MRSTHRERRERESARRGTTALVTAAALLFALPACSSGLPVTTRERAFAGPTITIDSTGPKHTVIVTAPTAGYLVSLDDVRDRMGGREALISVRPPDPRFVVAQVLTTHRLGTDVASTTPLDVFARVLPRDSRENVEYVLAGTTERPAPAN